MRYLCCTNWRCYQTQSSVLITNHNAVRKPAGLREMSKVRCPYCDELVVGRGGGVEACERCELRSGQRVVVATALILFMTDLAVVLKLLFG